MIDWNPESLLSPSPMLSRRQALSWFGNGFGMIGLAGLMKRSVIR